MWNRIASLFAAACLLAGAAAADQSSPKPPVNDDCLVCHGDATAKRDDGRSVAVAATVFEASTHGPMACVDCHTDLAKNAELPHAATLEKVNCGSCHDDIAGKYHDSIHSWAREKAGLVVAPSCADCHGAHDVKRHTDAESRVYRTRIPATCGTCHVGIKERYDAGVHAAALKEDESRPSTTSGRGDGAEPRAPSCADCHTAHAIRRVETDAWRLSVTRECGTCHVESLQTFRDTFHGQVTSLGFVRVAVCADCHGAHDIHPRADARSTVSSARLIETCQRCHKGASANFVKYDPHADRHSRARSPGLYYTGKFMDGLLISVFAFFGLHTALWFGRGMKARRQDTHPPDTAAAQERRDDR